jgi:hypothetical protein
MHTPEERAAILSEARANADRPRYMPRRYTEPSVPDRVAEWRRQAEELATQREAAQLTDSIAARIVDKLYARLEEVRAEFEAKLQYEHRFILDVVKGALEHVQSNLLDEINTQVGQLRAEMNVADKSLNANVIDLPNPLPARRTAS